MTMLAEIGVRGPRICQVPEYESSEAGREAIEFAAEVAGLVLDPWEAFVLEQSLGETAEGLWAASEIGLVVPRQNGKDAVLEARELAGLFLFKEPLILHSAHHFKTAQEHHRRLVGLIEGSDELSRRVKRISRSHGEEGIELIGGQWIRFFARTKGGGRGFTAPLVIFNEAMMLPEESLGALLPTQAAMRRRQRWFAGSAVDQMIHENGVVLARLRERGLAGDDPRLAYFEYSLDVDSPDALDDATLNDEESWAEANPGLGIRITVDAVEDELRSLDRRTFAVERLGVGDWPKSVGAGAVIDLEKWAALVDAQSKITGPACFVCDVSPDRSRATISAAGRRPDGLFHVEVVDFKRGTGWVVDRLVDLTEKHESIPIVYDGVGPVASLMRELEERGVGTTAVSAKEYAQACALLFDAVEQRKLRHLGTSELTSAIRGAAKRPLGDAWAWSRKSSGVDITSLVSCTLALWGTIAAPPASSGWRGL